MDGNKVAEKVSNQIISKVRSLSFKPHLLVICVGNDQASHLYVKTKYNKCKQLGCECTIHYMLESTTAEEIIDVIRNSSADGIMVQLPLPKHIDTRKICDSIPADKDVDCLNSSNLKRIMLGDEYVLPCTPKGILTMLSYYKVKLEGKRVGIVGYSNIVGKPLAMLMANRLATVTICNRKSNLKKSLKGCDIIISAVGKPKLITQEMVSKNAVVIDVGISKVNNKIVGDVDKINCKLITPVPGGVGPMTVVSLAENLLLLASNKTSIPFAKRVMNKCESAKTVFIYVSKSDEANTLNIIPKLLKAGKEVCVPYTMFESRLIIPSRIIRMSDLALNQYGIWEPKHINEVSASNIDIFFVPGTAFDAEGNRKGRGLGCFDRFLANIKGKKPIIGLCKKDQLVEKVNTHSWDIPADEVITE